MGRSLRAASPRGSWARWAAVLGVLILLLASAKDAAANCQNGSATQTVSAGNNLYNIMAVSTAPCTLSVGPGTYTAPTPNNFTIASGITVRSTGGSSVTTLQVAPDAFSAVSIWPLNGSCPSGATLEGFALTGGVGGVFVGAGLSGHVGCASNRVSGVTLRNLVINFALVYQTGGHGIDFHSVQSSVIDNCTVNSAFANGIFLETGSNNNIVMNSRVFGTMSQQAIAVQSSDDNVIVGNTVSVVSAFDGIFLNSSVGLSGPGSSRNRIERNTISGHKVDAIVLNDASGANYVGLNTAVSSSYVPGSPTAPTFTSGTGIWVNNASNANYLFGNDVSGSPENGIDILSSKSTLLVANRVHGNWQGGVWVANVLFSADPAAPAPQDTVLQGNNIFFNSTSSQIHLQGALNSQAAFNYLSGVQGGTIASEIAVAFEILDSARANIFENTVSEIGARAVVSGATTNVSFFRNRFLKGTNIPRPAQTDGRNGVTYSLAPADVHWDGGSFLGGNHWSDFTGASGNPDLAHPYTAFIGNTNGAPYADRYPYQSESLQTASAPNSVTVVEPFAGSVLAAQTRKTVRWVARGCVLVDLYYASGGSSPALIASGVPNTGYYFWDVPGVPFRTDYYVEVVCANSNASPLGVSGNSPTFAIASNDLVLLNPGRGSRVADGSVVRVAWKASSAVSGVNIFVKSGGGETQVATNVTGTTFRDITLPSGVSSSSRVTIRIQDSGSSARQDSVDGYFMVRGASPSFATVWTNGMLQVGSVRILEWTGVSGSYTVDLDLVGQTTTPIARNLPDFGSFTWLVDDMPSADARIRATFKDANGNTVATIDSGTFSVVRDMVSVEPPAAATRGDLDGDGKADITVFRPSNGTWYVRYSSVGYTTSGAFQWGNGNDLPVPADYDGDGKIDVAVFRPSDGTWYVLYTGTGATAGFQWGNGSDVPVPGDYNGDGKTDFAVFRPSNGTWYIWYSGTQTTAGFQWGNGTDVPVPGDYNGDSKTDIAVFRPSNGTWYIAYSGTQATAGFQWGNASDAPVSGDYNGDGKTDLAVFRPSTGTWYIWYSGTQSTAGFQWGNGSDIPVPGDFDGDRKTDLALFRPSTGVWWVWSPSTGVTASFAWGNSADIPILKR